MTYKNKVIMVKDEKSGREGAYKQIDENTILMLDPATENELCRIEKKGDIFDILVTSEEISRFIDTGAIRRCCNGCDIQGGGPSCYAKCFITNGGTWG